MSDEKTFSQMRQDFYEKYQKVILPCVKKREQDRKNNLSLAIVITFICVTVGVVGLVCLISLDCLGKNNDLLKFPLFIMALPIVFCSMIKKRYENSVKREIMPVVCSCFANLAWQQGERMQKIDYESAGIVPYYTRSHYDDIFSGSYKGVDFYIEEVCYEKGSGKNRKTVFDGVILRLDMNKNFSGHTVITGDTIFHSSPLPELKHTTLEDANFEKKFDVFTNDEVEARYLITPTFMERLKNTRIAFMAYGVRCAFYKNYLYIALSTDKDLFSLCSLLKPMEDSQQFFQMYEEIVSIMKLIDHFKLNQKIGL